MWWKNRKKAAPKAEPPRKTHDPYRTTASQIAESTSASDVLRWMLEEHHERMTLSEQAAKYRTAIFAAKAMFRKQDVPDDRLN